MAAAKLSEALQPASFRGVPFQVDGTEFGAGRRNQVHEYPQRDKPYVEDLGRATRDLSFDGFLVGADYLDQVTKLLGALESPGAGTLVHPWFGSLRVSVKDLARVSFNGALGYARVSMSFIESGELEFPSAGDSTQTQSRFAAASIETSAIDAFAESFSIDGVQDFVADAALADLSAVMDLVAGDAIPGLDVLGYASGAANHLEGMLDMVSSPLALGRELAGFFNLAPLVSGATGIFASTVRWSSLIGSLLRLWESPQLLPPVQPTIYTPSRQRAYGNTRATNALVRQSLLAQAVGLSSLVPATVFEETMDARNRLTAAIDTESLTAPDVVYTALVDARGKVWKDLTSRSRDSARLATLQPPATLPALVLAYDYYEDAGRDGDIVARNGIRHPGFVPPDPLRLLTR